MLSLTIQSAAVSDGALEVTYARNGDGGGHGIRFRGAYDEITESELEMLILKLAYTWARRRNVSAAQVVGKTITIDPTVLRNLISIA